MSERLSKELANEIDALRPELDDERLGAQRARLTTSWRRDLRHRRLRRTGAGATVAVCALAGWLAITYDGAPAFRLEGRTASGERVGAGDWLETSPNSVLKITLNEGSRILVDEATRARVIQLSNGEVDLAVEVGRLRTTVTPGRRWRVRAGPYTVLVLGTRFSVEWCPERLRLEVSVSRGRVKVSGGSIDPGGLSVSAGQVLAADLTHAEVRLSQRRPPRHDASSAEDAAPARPAPDASMPPISDASVPARPPAHAKRARRLPRWVALAEARRFSEAAAAARDIGLERLFERLGRERLLLLAHTLRLARQPNEAHQAWLVLRRRFSGSAAAASAAFQLGRAAFDVHRDYRGAARWFETFLRHRPMTPALQQLVPFALGRLMTAYERADQHDEARRVAKRYLALDPTGSYAPSARRILNIP